MDLKKFIKWAASSFDLSILEAFLNATPTAELEPITSSYVQSDEADMGMTYAELSVFGYLRKVAKMGPWSMYEKLLHLWGKEYSPREIYEKTRRFFHYYAINRHKMTVLTPSYHAEQYSPDDNRHDLRQFLCKCDVLLRFPSHIQNLSGRANTRFLVRPCVYLGVQEDGRECCVLGIKGFYTEEQGREEGLNSPVDVSCDKSDAYVPGVSAPGSFLFKTILPLALRNSTAVRHSRVNYTVEYPVLHRRQRTYAQAPSTVSNMYDRNVPQFGSEAAS